MGGSPPVEGPLVGQGVGACVVRPEMTEGPYFVDERLQRSDIRGDPADGSVRDGALLALTFNVARAGARCTPLAGAVLDLWHCDALGVYSDVQDPGFDTTGQQFLRGYQVTDADGVARFTTIFPGWYQGRTVHLHFKLRSPASAPRSWAFTSQLFFTDTLTDTVHAQQPYAAKGQRSLRNSGDGIYRAGGAQLVLDVHPTPAGFGASFDIALEGV
jgi:protocatechuate 3,4-dioxygenase beta subunit